MSVGNIDKLKSFTRTPQGRLIRDTTIRSTIINNNQDNILNDDEYLNETNREDEIKNEQKFKKIFTSKGRFSKLAKEKCRNIINR